MFRPQEKLSKDENLSSISSMQTEKCNQNYSLKDYPIWLRTSLIKNLLIEQEYFKKRRDDKHSKMSKMQQQMSINQKNRRRISSKISEPKCTPRPSRQNLDYLNKFPIKRLPSDREYTLPSSPKIKKMYRTDSSINERPRIAHSSKSKEDDTTTTTRKSNHHQNLKTKRSVSDSSCSKSRRNESTRSTRDSTSNSRRDIHKSKSIEIERKLRRNPDSNNKKPHGRRSGSEFVKKSSKKPKERAKLNESSASSSKKFISTTSIGKKNSGSKESIQSKNDDESIIVQIVEKRDGLENIYAKKTLSTISKSAVEIGDDKVDGSEEARNDLIGEKDIDYNILIQEKEILEENFKNDSIDVNINIDFDDLMTNGDIFTPPPTPQQQQIQQQQNQLIDIDSSELELIKKGLNEWDIGDIFKQIFETDANLMDIDESFFATSQP